MEIKLERPVVFFDVETTGLDLVNDRIIELCMIKLFPNGEENRWYSKINPEGRPSRPEAIEKHGITDDQLSDQDRFQYLAPEIYGFIEGCDLGGYNILRFDLPILTEEFIRAGIPFNYRNHKIIDSYLILSKMEPRNLEHVYERMFGEKLENAHSAEADIEATIRVFQKQAEMYNLPSSAADIEKLSTDRDEMADLGGKYKIKDGKIIFNFGKYKDRDVKEVYSNDSGYFDWLMRADGFTREMKIITQKIQKKLSGN
jgi:DNA polymerase-3 subunit epsilon